MMRAKKAFLKTVALAGLLALALSPAAALAGQRAALRDDLNVSGAEVRLGDLFDNAGEAANVLVARATGPVLVLDARQVQAIAAARGLDWANPNGYRQLVVHTALTRAAAIPAAAGPAASLSAREAAPAAEKTVEALTWTRSLMAGEVVRPEDLAWTKVPAHVAPHEAPRDAEALIGQTARRPLREGSAAVARDLAPAKVIHRDQEVQVTFAMDGIRLVLSGKALADAAVGDPVQVLNTQSKKTIEAVASGPGRADVGPEADALRSSRVASLP
jgi:flagellar basal body P-ring formation protein FlgA